MNIEQKLQEAISKHQEGRLEEAEKIYLDILKIDPKNADVYNNLGILFQINNKFEEAIEYYKKAIEFKSDFAEAYNNLGFLLQKLKRFDEAVINYNEAIALKIKSEKTYYNLGIILNELGKLDEAEASYRQAIILKPDFANAYLNIAIISHKLKKFEEAIANYKKTIEFKSDHAEIHNNLGTLLKEIGRIDEAEIYYKKAIELKPDFAEAYSNMGSILQDLGKLKDAEAQYEKAINLQFDRTKISKNLNDLSKQKELLSNIEQKRKSQDKIKKNFTKKNNIRLTIPESRLTSNLYISKRKVETELINNLQNINCDRLEKLKKRDARYGNGKCSDFLLFENDFTFIKNVKKDLIETMKQGVNSDIFIMESFLNILGPSSGVTPHKHVDTFDKNLGLVNQKFSLVYYLDVGDQNCDEPGILKLEDPDEEILPTEGMIMIFPADRKHSAAYGGKTDRIMIGVNFYSII